MHGGLSPSLMDTDLSQINHVIERPTDVPKDGLLCDLLWSDPMDKPGQHSRFSPAARRAHAPSASGIMQGWQPSDRGVSFKFSEQVVEKFCDRHDLDLICRAHQVVEDGYEFFSERRLVTVFSAPNYCG